MSVSSVAMVDVGVCLVECGVFSFGGLTVFFGVSCVKLGKLKPPSVSSLLARVQSGNFCPWDECWGVRVLSWVQTSRCDSLEFPKAP